jgi:hypothetical protein
MKPLIRSLFRAVGYLMRDKGTPTHEDIERRFLEYHDLESTARKRRTAGAARFAREKRMALADAMRLHDGLPLRKETDT